jgi:hypothetical protein
MLARLEVCESSVVKRRAAVVAEDKRKQGPVQRLSPSALSKYSRPHWIHQVEPKTRAMHNQMCSFEAGTQIAKIETPQIIFHCTATARHTSHSDLHISIPTDESGARLVCIPVRRS